MPDSTPPPVGSTEPNAPAPSSTGLTPNVAAGLAVLFPLVGGIVFFVFEKKDKFVRSWAMQSIFLGGLAFTVSVALWVAGFIFGHLPLIGVLMLLGLGLAHFAFGVVWFIGWVIALVKAFSGEEWDIPWLGKLARKQLERIDAAAPPPA